MKYIVIIFAIFAYACSPKARLNNLLKHHPELFTKQVDSAITYVFKTDTIVIPSDTVELLNLDTVIHTDHNVITVTRDKIKIIRLSDTITEVDTLTKIVYNEKTTLQACVHPNQVLISKIWYHILIIISVLFSIFILRHAFFREKTSSKNTEN